MSDPARAASASASELKHLSWDQIPTETVNALFERKLLVGHEIMVAHVHLKKGAVVPQHSHHNEQISHGLSGTLQFTIDGRELLLKPGEFLCIPPDLPHAAVAVEDFIGIDIFTPPRADWLAKTDDYLRR